MGVLSKAKKEGKSLPVKLPKFEPYFFTDFEAGSDEDWWEVLAGTWRVEDGVLKQRAAVSHTQIVLPDVELDDVYVRGLAYNYGGEAHLTFRSVDNDNFYFVGTGGWDDKFSIAKRIGGSATQLATTGGSTITGEWIKVEVWMRGTNIVAVLNDGEERLTASDSDLAKGNVGCRTMDNDADFDDFGVRRL